jgi:hypothetical protein
MLVVRASPAASRHSPSPPALPCLLRDQEAHPGRARDGLLQELQSLADEFDAGIDREPGHVAPWARETGREPQPDGIRGNGDDLDRRRFLLSALAGVLAAPLAAEAQPKGKLQRLAIVYPAGPVAEMTEAQDPMLRVLFSELRRLGYVEGQTLVVERRSGSGRRESYPDVAREVVGLKPDVVYAGSGRMAAAFRATTTTIPSVPCQQCPAAVGATISTPRPSNRTRCWRSSRAWRERSRIATGTACTVALNLDHPKRPGSPWRPGNSRHHGRTRAYFYQCRAALARGSACTNTFALAMAVTDRALLSYLEGTLLHPDVIAEAVQRALAPDPTAESPDALRARLQGERVFSVVKNGTPRGRVARLVVDLRWRR